MDDFRHRKADIEKLLVTGVDCVVGANLAVSLGDRCEVVGLYQAHPVFLPGCATARWPPAHPAQWSDVFRRERPQWIIHCGPLAQGSWDIPNQAPDGQQEARTCSVLARVCARMGSRLAVITSDAVFAGPRLFHDEKAPRSSRQPFAQAVRRAEEALEATGALVVRTHAYGWSPAAGSPGFAERVWETLIEGRPAHYHPDRHATPIPATILAELLWVACRRGLRGRYHISGAERTSAYRFAAELAAAFGLRCADATTDQGTPDRGPADHLHETSLSTRRARRELGCPMPMLREGLNCFAEQAANGFRARLQSCAPHPAVTADAA